MGQNFCLKEQGIVMIMTTIYRTILIILLGLLASCGTPEFVPTKDICKIEKHWRDNLFQVQINEEPINKHWYFYEDAVAIAKDLGKKNLCMK
jgi:hypothetical protein